MRLIHMHHRRGGYEIDMLNGPVMPKLLTFAVEQYKADCLWALEKNDRAIAFYKRHGFHKTGERKLEEGTSEYLIRMAR